MTAFSPCSFIVSMCSPQPCIPTHSIISVIWLDKRTDLLHPLLSHAHSHRLEWSRKQCECELTRHIRDCVAHPFREKSPTISIADSHACQTNPRGRVALQGITQRRRLRSPLPLRAASETKLIGRHIVTQHSTGLLVRRCNFLCG